MGPFEQDPDDLAELQQQFTPPSLPVQYSQADDLTRQRLEAGLSSVQDDIDDGNLHPDYGEPIKQRIAQRLAPLLQRREATKAQAKQQMLQDAMEQNAHSQALLQMDATNDANHFLDRTSQVIDPISGRMAHFYQSEPGKWTQMQFEADEPSGGGEGQGGDFSDGSTDMSDYQNPETSVPVEEAPVQQSQQHMMEVINGPFREVHQFQNGKLSASQHFDPFGRPLTQASFDSPLPGMPSQAELSQIDMAVQQSLRGMAPGPRRDIYAARLKDSMVNRLMVRKNQEQQQLGFAQERQRREKVAADTKALNDEIKQRSDIYERRLSALQNERLNYIQKGIDPSKWPAEIKDEAAMTNSARSFVKDALGGWSPQLKEHYRQRGVDVDGTSQPQPQQPQNPAVVSDATKVIESFASSPEEKAQGLGAIKAAQSVISKYGSLDAAPKAEREAAIAELRKLDKMLTEAKRRRAEAVKNAPRGGFGH